MSCKGQTTNRNNCKRKALEENGLCETHQRMEDLAEPWKPGFCKHINNKYRRCKNKAYQEGEDKDYCAHHSKMILELKKKWKGAGRFQKT